MSALTQPIVKLVIDVCLLHLIRLIARLCLKAILPSHGVTAVSPLGTGLLRALLREGRTVPMIANSELLTAGNPTV